jgi:hypothetical protein
MAPRWKKARSVAAAVVVVAVAESGRSETTPREKPHSRRTKAWQSSPK